MHKVFFTSENQIFAHLWQKICYAYNQAIKAKGEFDLMLSGGNTPIKFYTYLFQHENVNSLDWSKVNIFFSDERYVPISSEQSNYKQAKEFFLNKITVKNIFNFNTDLPAEESAQDMSLKVNKHFKLGANEVPEFDLCFLGFGDDGHFASIFPDVPLESKDELICYSRFIDKLSMYRLTFTLSVFNHARQLFFVVNNSNKVALIDELGCRKIKLPIDYLAGKTELEWLILNAN